MALNIELRVGDSLRIGEATITLADKSGKIARLSIQAPQSVPIHRTANPTPSQIAAKIGLSVQHS